MAKNIDPNLRKIGTYLKLEKDAIFTIPEYQRAYSWRIEHCDKLWSDILDFSDSDSDDGYFFGTIIANCYDNDKKFGLIDGQQRTTTFLLLLKALLIRINAAIQNVSKDQESESLCRGLRERRRQIIGILYKTEPDDIEDTPNPDKDAKFYNSPRILENYSINEQYSEDFGTILSSSNYEAAEQNVIKIPRRQKDNKYTNFFRNFKFFYEKAGELPESRLNTITKTIIDKCEVIEIKSWQVEQAITMFNSLNSDGLPLCDADIISAKLYAEAESLGQREKFAKLWGELLELIDKLESKGIASIDSILMQHMYYTRTRLKETVSETGAINVTTPGLRRYYTEINKDILKQPIELCESMIKLARMWDQASNYPSVQVLLKFNENAKLFLASYFYRFDGIIEEDKIKTIVESLLKLFTIMELVDAGYSSKYFKTFLFGAEIKLINHDVSVSEIAQDFVAHIVKNWDKDQIKTEIMDYDDSMLVYLNEYLFAQEKNLSFNLQGKYDIEHIMPISGRNLQEIQKDANIENEDEFKAIVNKLGNKILLEEKINRSIGNEWFRTKISKRLEDKAGYVDSRFPIARTLVMTYQNQDKPYWTKEDIQDATNKASERIINFIFGE